MNQLGTVLLEAAPAVHSLFVYNCNPAIVTPESNKVRQGLIRDDLFTVVHDLFLTETAKYADIVLPATSSFENTDFYTSYWHHYIHLQQPIIEPYEESKSNSDVFRLLARAMGFEEEALLESDEELIRQAVDHKGNISYSTITYDQLLKNLYVKANRDAFSLSSLPTPSGKIELYSKTMEKEGYPPLPTHMPLVQEEHFPFLFVPGPNHNFLNSTFSNNQKHRELEKNPIVHMNERDAKKLDIDDKELVRIWNDRGECQLTVSVGTNVLPGVLVTQGLYADLAGDMHLVNALTPDRLADMGGGATFFSGRVACEKMT
ncbi:anaerobic dehydrogenases [Halalkalibacter wakoensis JCM 9140]|uniref:Anaerobic dehydrogenases n=1 Tax=Halalkalibacter wakoensis JCM 9140 TaxID=1236970 RepID=W4PZG5_9BACI|nr:anaerobic dehydrogenases [Halalkalibacter wakoensis JCM 9140]